VSESATMIVAEVLPSTVRRRGRLRLSLGEMMIGIAILACVLLLFARPWLLFLTLAGIHTIGMFAWLLWMGSQRPDWRPRSVAERAGVWFGVLVLGNWLLVSLGLAIGPVLFPGVAGRFIAGAVVWFMMLALIVDLSVWIFAAIVEGLRRRRARARLKDGVGLLGPRSAEGASPFDSARGCGDAR
jgi:hypothetical protein